MRLREERKQPGRQLKAPRPFPMALQACMQERPRNKSHKDALNFTCTRAKLNEEWEGGEEEKNSTRGVSKERAGL